MSALVERPESEEAPRIDTEGESPSSMGNPPPEDAGTRDVPAWARAFPMGPGAAWVATLLATAVAAVLRLVGLDRVRALMFDETYYVKDAYSLAHLGYEGTWAGEWDQSFAAGDFSGLGLSGSYIVHPQTGKWLIALGMQIFGWDNPVGWRISAAVAGIVGVFLVCRIAWNLFRSPAITLMAGVFLATDGMHLVMSRTGLLDIFLTTFVLAAFLAVIKDQQQAHPTLVRKLTAWDPVEKPGWGPHSGSRWWLVAAGVLLGLACSVKWSGIYALAVLGLFVALREWTTRRRHGHPRPFRAALLLDIPVAFLALVPTAIVVYVASWWAWMIHPAAWAHGRTAAAGGPQSGPLAVLSDLWSYHREMWGFHNGLSSPHNYQSQPWGWLLQLRPTSFWYEKVPGPCGGASASGSECVQNVVALGNPLMWWLAVPALALALWAVARWGNWRVGLVLCGYLAMYAPWFAYAHRTIFTFYTVAFAPFVALVLAWALGVALDQARLRVDPDRGYSASDFNEGDHRWLGSRDGLRLALALLAGLVVVVVLAASAYFYTVWTGPSIPYRQWLDRMWLDSWI